MQNVMAGEAYFLSKGYNSPRNIVFFAEECMGPEIASATSPLDEIMPKVIIGICLFLYSGGTMLST